MHSIFRVPYYDVTYWCSYWIRFSSSPTHGKKWEMKRKVRSQHLRLSNRSPKSKFPRRHSGIALWVRERFETTSTQPLSMHQIFSYLMKVCSTGLVLGLRSTFLAAASSKTCKTLTWILGTLRAYWCWRLAAADVQHDELGAITNGIDVKQVYCIYIAFAMMVCSFYGRFDSD